MSAALSYLVWHTSLRQPGEPICLGRSRTSRWHLGSWGHGEDVDRGSRGQWVVWGGGPSFTIRQRWSWCSPFILRISFNWFPERHPGKGVGCTWGPPNSTLSRGTDGEPQLLGGGVSSCLPRQDSSLSSLIGTGGGASSGRRQVHLALVMGRQVLPQLPGFGGGDGVGTSRPGDSSRRGGQEREVEPG